MLCTIDLGLVHHVHVRKKGRQTKSMKPPRAPGTYRATFLRQWREHRVLTLEKAASRIGEIMGVSLSYSQLSRIERGEQPYSQAILEAAADAYGTDPASILMRNPKDPDAIWSIWDQAQPGQRRTIVEVAKTILKTGT